MSQMCTKLTVHNICSFQNRKLALQNWEIPEINAFLLLSDQLCISGPLSEELHCSICLDLFSDPVTTPCGHNFCKTCLDMFWDSCEKCTCPYCKETFDKCPDLRCNTALREIVQLFEKNTGKYICISKAFL